MENKNERQYYKCNSCSRQNIRKHYEYIKRVMNDLKTHPLKINEPDWEMEYEMCFNKDTTNIKTDKKEMY